MKLTRRTLLRSATGVFVCFVCLSGNRIFLEHIEKFYPVENWLVWHLLQLIAWTVVLQGSFVAIGNTLLRRLLPTGDFGTAERLVFSMTLGFALFALSMFLGGALGIYNWGFAVSLPLLFWGFGARDVPALWKESFAPRPGALPRKPWARIASGMATAFGVVMITLLYLTCLTPHSFNFDAIWYHVPVAQDYARVGGIVPFYGDNHRAYPQLTSLVHTWALLVPGIEPLPVRWMLMLHLEFSFVLWRLLGAAAAAQWLLGGRWIPGLWASFFLYPSVFIYDQNIAGSADHVLGATAVPVFLATGRLLKDFDWRWAVVAGVGAGCHILTRYQAIYVVVAVAGTVGARFFWLVGKKAWGRVRRGDWSASPLSFKKLIVTPLIVVAVAGAVSAPQFVKNWIYYDNPIYPLGSSVFPSSFEEFELPKVRVSSLEAEQNADAKGPAGRSHGSARAPTIRPKSLLLAENQRSTLAERTQRLKRVGRASSAQAEDADDSVDDEADVDDVDSNESDDDVALEDELVFEFPRRSYDFSPKGETLVERLVWLHQTLIDWSFETGNRNLTKHRPYMGSLFTLLLPVLLFLQPARRLWFGVVFCYFAFCTWGLTNANDRYLLAFLSVPIAISAALVVRTWKLGVLARLGLVPLVAVQLFWGIDAPLHYGDRSLNDAVKLVHRGYTRARDPDIRFRYRQTEQDLTEKFPEDALILGRYFKDIVGFDRATLNTHRAIQKYIPLKRMRNIRDFWFVAKERGVTHLLYPAGKRKPHWLQDIVLFDALVEASPNKGRFKGYVFAELPKEPPQVDDKHLMVLVLGDRMYEDGLYAVKNLSVDERSSGRNLESPKEKYAYSQKNAEELLEQAGAVVMRGSRLPNDLEKKFRKEFDRVERFGSLGIYLRK